MGNEVVKMDAASVAVQTLNDKLAAIGKSLGVVKDGEWKPSNKKTSAMVASAQTRSTLVSVVTGFGRVDTVFGGGMKAAGQVILAVVKLKNKDGKKDSHAQGLVINEIAAANGLQPTDKVGVEGFAYAIFGSNPDMMKVEGKAKQSRAAKRVSNYIQAALGTRRPKAQKPSNASGSDASGSDASGSDGTGGHDKTDEIKGEFFSDLLDACENKTEQTLLLKLAKKADFDPAPYIG